VLRHVYSKYAWYFKLFKYALPTEQKIENEISHFSKRSQSLSLNANMEGIA